MLKKFISLLLCLCIVLSCGIFAFAQGSYSKTVPEAVRIIDGIGSLFKSLFGLMSLRTDYPDCHQLCEIPELEKGYVPQGFCYIDTHNLFAITYYRDDDDNSILVLMDAESGERVKTVKLAYEDGDPCLAHVGGVADVGDSLLISSGKSVRRLKIADALNAEDYGYAFFCGKLATHMQASYVCAYENYLFVGQFYTFTPTNSYETPAEQRLYTPNGKRNYAMCEKYDLSDIDAVFKAGSADPDMVISMPNDVQGIAFDGEIFATSSSATARNASKIRYYNLVESEYTYNMAGAEVPLYFLTEKDAIKTVKIPPMSEGIDWFNGKVTGIFESGAQKFKNARPRTPYVCSYE